MIYNFFKNKSLSCEKLLGIFFILFLFYYLINFDLFNKLSSNDYLKGFKPEGIVIINQILNFELNKVNYFDTHFIVKLITGFLQKITSNELSFSITSNLLNMILLFLSMYFFLKSINYEYSNIMIIIFLLIFFSYKANWIWCFRKLPDIYFLFNFSLIFYFVSKSLNTNKTYYILIALFFSIISMFVRPQGIINLGFVIICLFYLSYKKIDILKLVSILAVLYIISYPFLIYILTRFDGINIFQNALQLIQSGQIYYDIYYTQNDFYNQFSISDNIISETLYYYLLFFKKLIYQLTFIRESYSFNHNLFLIFYLFTIYILIIFFFNELLEKYKNFLQLTYIISILSLLFHSSIFIGGEPNRYQLFHLTPLYLLVSLSFVSGFEKFLEYLDRR